MTAAADRPVENERSNFTSRIIGPQLKGQPQEPELPHPVPLQAGRELDALIAEKIFGWRLVHWTGHNGSWSRNSAFPSERRAEFEASYHYAVDGWVTPTEAHPDVKLLQAILEQRGYPIPRYSTDIGSAWEVHLKVCEMLFSVRRRYFHALQEQTRDGGNLVAWPDVLVVLRKQFPEAICHAALRAIGEVSS